MTVVCPRCATANSSWDKRCRACWLPIDAAWALAENCGNAVADEPAPNEAHIKLAGQLGIEITHVRALADAEIHTLEHVAESLPEKIAHALRALTHIDPEEIIARARRLLYERDTTIRSTDWWSDAR